MFAVLGEAVPSIADELPIAEVATDRIWGVLVAEAPAKACQLWRGPENRVSTCDDLGRRYRTYSAASLSRAVARRLRPEASGMAAASASTAGVALARMSLR